MSPLHFFPAILLILSLWMKVTLCSSDIQYRKSMLDSANRLGRCYSKTAALSLPNFGACTKEDYLGDFTAHQLNWLDSLSPARERDSYPVVVRKDIRLFTDEERENFLSILRGMNDDYFVDALSEFNMFLSFHNYGVSVAPQPPTPSINAAFFSWHRAASTFLEKALQSHISTIAMPMWDVLLDVYLPEIKHSVLWSKDFLGNCGPGGLKSPSQPNSSLYVIKTGKLGFWEKFHSCYTTNRSMGGIFKYLSRACTSKNKFNIRTDKTFSDYDLKFLLEYTSVKDLSSTACLGDDHFALHEYLDPGDSNEGIRPDAGCGTVADPLVWLLHTFTDYIFALFRQTSQKTDLETEYPVDNSTAYCYMPEYRLTPFPLKMIDGFSLDFTRYHYVYEHTPTFCSSDVECGNPKWIWCDVALNRCKSKIVSGGDCFGHPDNACASGSCVSNKCAWPEEEKD